MTPGKRQNSMTFTDHSVVVMEWSMTTKKAGAVGRRGRNNLTEETHFFVTATIENFKPVFSDEQCCQILMDNLSHYKNKYQFKILGYVIMPTHFHWIAAINKEKGTISDIMRDVKKYSAWEIMDYLEMRAGKKFVISDSSLKDQNRQLWKKRFDDEVIRNENMFWAKLNYIHNNPVKAGLVERDIDYKFSSARNYLLDDYSVMWVDIYPEYHT